MTIGQVNIVQKKLKNNIIINLNICAMFIYLGSKCWKIKDYQMKMMWYFEM